MGRGVGSVGSVGSPTCAPGDHIRHLPGLVCRICASAAHRRRKRPRIGRDRASGGRVGRVLPRSRPTWSSGARRDLFPPVSEQNERRSARVESTRECLDGQASGDRERDLERRCSFPDRESVSPCGLDDQDHAAHAAVAGLACDPALKCLEVGESSFGLDASRVAGSEYHPVPGALFTDAGQRDLGPKGELGGQMASEPLEQREVRCVAQG